MFTDRLETISKPTPALAEVGCEILAMRERYESMKTYYVNLIGGGPYE